MFTFEMIIVERKDFPFLFDLIYLYSCIKSFSKKKHSNIDTQDAHTSTRTDDYNWGGAKFSLMRSLAEIPWLKLIQPPVSLSEVIIRPMSNTTSSGQTLIHYWKVMRQDSTEQACAGWLATSADEKRQH